MHEPIAALYYVLSLALGRVLRAGRYASVLVVDHAGETRVRKRRLFYAPFLVWLGRPLVRILNTGSRVLSQREWEQREQLLYRELYGVTVRVEADGTLVLPYLPGITLARLLDRPALGAPDRARAIDLAVTALSELHARGFTHGDAMAENVMVDLEAGFGRWFDFETLHDADRPLAWRRADDVRALLATTLSRTPPDQLDGTLGPASGLRLRSGCRGVRRADPRIRVRMAAGPSLPSRSGAVVDLAVS